MGPVESWGEILGLVMLIGALATFAVFSATDRLRRKRLLRDRARE